MRIGTLKASELDSKQRLTPASYLHVDDHELEISALVVVRSKSPSGQQINEAERIKVKFNVEQVKGILRAKGAKTVDEIREQVADLIRNNIVHALTEATRTR